MHIQGPQPGDSAICTALLTALPEWFGIPESNKQYAQTIPTLPTFLAMEKDEPIGLLSIRQHFALAAEIYLIAVHPKYHGQRIGHALVDAAEIWLRGRHVTFLQVKTLSPSRESECYARTRRFYESVGFTPFEELPTLWDERNPCLIMIKSL